jgi:hypothetical protein
MMQPLFSKYRHNPVYLRLDNISETETRNNIYLNFSTPIAKTFGVWEFEIAAILDGAINKSSYISSVKMLQTWQGR